MNQTHSRTPCQQAQWVSTLLAHRGSYGVVTIVSQELGVARQTLYRWKAGRKGRLQRGLYTPPARSRPFVCVGAGDLDEAFGGPCQLSGHSAVPADLARTGGELGNDCLAAVVQTAGQRVQPWLASQMPTTAWALDELYGSQRGAGYLTVVDAGSGAVWASTSPVAVDGESWTLLLWQLEEQGLRWYTVVSDGGKAIGEAVGTVAAEQSHQRDVWHVLHLCQQVQGRLDRQVTSLQGQTSVVARQAARVAAGKLPRGRHPQSDVEAHALQVA